MSGTVNNGQLTYSATTVSAGAGLSGGGPVSLGGTINLTNTGVLTVTGNADITATPTNGNVVLGDTATSTNVPNTLVKRDSTGSFAAGSVNLSSNLTAVSATLGGNLNLPVTTATAGIIYSGGSTLMHAYGLDNFFGGASAGNLTLAGAYNVGIGVGALSVNGAGGDNTAVGFQSLYENISGNFNTAVGAAALLYSSGGGTNIALGYQAGHSFTGSESGNIDIGNPGVLGENNTIRIGSGQANTFLAGVIHGNGGGLTNVSAAALIGLNTNNFWQTGGNVGTTPGDPGFNYLGTADNQPLELHVNGQLAFRVEPGGDDGSGAANVIGGYGNNVNYYTIIQYEPPVFNGFVGSAIGGGTLNSISDDYCFIGGGEYNSIHNIYSIWPYTFQGGYSVIGGGANNSINNAGGYSAIGGGYSNNVVGSYATIGGGQLNTAIGNGSSIGGGNNNTIRSIWSWRNHSGR